MERIRAVADANIKKTIVFTGAMVPWSIDKGEASLNFGMALGCAQNPHTGVYIAMHGICAPYKNVSKNRTVGKFEYVER